MYHAQTGSESLKILFENGGWSLDSLLAGDACAQIINHMYLSATHVHIGRFYLRAALYCPLVSCLSFQLLDALLCFVFSNSFYV